MQEIGLLDVGCVGLLISVLSLVGFFLNGGSHAQAEGSFIGNYLFIFGFLIEACISLISIFIGWLFGAHRSLDGTWIIPAVFIGLVMLFHAYMLFTDTLARISYRIRLRRWQKENAGSKDANANYDQSIEQEI